MIEPRQLLTRFRLFEQQSRVLANDRGIDVVVAGVGGGKTWIAALKTLFWALRHPRRPNGSATQWLVLGRDYKLVREVQLEEILGHIRNLCYVQEPRELVVKDARGPESERTWAFEGANGLTTLEPSPRAPVAARIEKWLEHDRYVARRLVTIPERALVARAVGGTEPCIELTTGAIFRGYSGTDVSRIRGLGIDGAWPDEAEYQTEDSFEMSCQRQRSGRGGLRVVVTSSPAEAGQGWLWSVISGKFPRWDPLRKANPLRVHRWASEDNPTNDPDQLASIRAIMDATRPGRSAGELDGLFVGTEEAPGTGPIDYARAFVGRVRVGAEDLRPAVIGVDVGETEDFTWLTVLSSSGLVLAMDRFNVSTPGVPRQGFYPYVEARVEQLAAKWRVPRIVVDVAKAGIGIQQHLEIKLRDRAKVEGYRTDAPGKKSAAIELLGTGLARGDVRIPSAWTGIDNAERVVEWTEYLRREFADLVVVDSGPKRSFTHPDGAHDDGIVSLALAWHAIAGSNRAGMDLSKWGTIALGGRIF